MMQRAAKATATGVVSALSKAKAADVSTSSSSVVVGRGEDLLFSRVEKNVNDGGTKQTTTSFCCFGDGE